jgi:cysteinyl-tRNA synthetase
MWLVTKVRGEEDIVLGAASTEEEAREMVCKSEAEEYMREQEALGVCDVDDDIKVKMRIENLADRIKKLNYKIERI